MLTGDNGILTQANRGKKEIEKAQEKEGLKLAITVAQIADNGYEELNLSNLQKAINNQFGKEKSISYR